MTQTLERAEPSLERTRAEIDQMLRYARNGRLALDMLHSTEARVTTLLTGVLEKYLPMACEEIRQIQRETRVAIAAMEGPDECLVAQPDRTVTREKLFQRLRCTALVEALRVAEESLRHREEGAYLMAHPSTSTHDARAFVIGYPSPTLRQVREALTLMETSDETGC